MPKAPIDMEGIARMLEEWRKNPPPEVLKRMGERLAERRLGMPRGVPGGVLTRRMGC